MRPVLPAVLRIVLLAFLGVSSSAILYATAMNERTVESLADRSLESTALALSTATESALRAGGGGTNSEVQVILSDRVVAYALIAEKDGTIRFHTNTRMTGTRLPEDPGVWLRTGQPSGRRVVLGTGLPAYEYNYILHPLAGGPELLRIVLHTTPADRILVGTRRMRWTVAAVLLLLWTVGIALDRMVSRQFRLQAETERQERLALIGQMTATLAHEIRNALGSVKGYTQWVSEKVDPSDPRKAGLESALRAAGRIESLVNELLLFSRQETYVTAPVPLLDIVRGTVTAESAGWAGRVEMSVEPGACAVADPEKLGRVLRNAVRNAFEAMGPEGILLVEGRRDGRWVEIRVEDTGPGISGDDLQKLFTPFHTTKPDGTGLGLAYSKKVVEGMGGRIG
ncbi:MAG: sensor histidine kinase, partial [Deltaproteobacteria bacterium]|nr:sensor histidine kinase [Deltaproteobacteria bacterium]